MLTLLIPVDGSGYADRAVEYVIRRAADSRGPVKVHLLNVQSRLVGVNVKIFINQGSLERYYREEGMAILEERIARLRAAGLECEPHIGVGNPGEVTVEYAKDKDCAEIVMGTLGRGGLTGAVMGSVAQKVVSLSPLPVVLVK